MTSSSLPFAWGGAPFGADPGWIRFKPREMNEKMYAVLSTDSRTQVVAALAEDLHLYRLPDAFFVLDTSKRTILYLMQFAEEVILEKRGIAKLRLWRNPGDIRTQDLGEQLFFEYLLPSADCVVSDPQVTSYGHSFWELRIFKALQMGYGVYLLDPNENTPKRLQSSAECQDELDALNPNRWSGKRLAICRSRIWG